MTIAEFMRDIAPKMKQGWVFMTQDNDWYYTPINDKPEIENCWGIDDWETRSFQHSLEMFDISPVDDWTQSLRKVGCHE